MCTIKPKLQYKFVQRYSRSYHFQHEYSLHPLINGSMHIISHERVQFCIECYFQLIPSHSIHGPHTHLGQLYHIRVRFYGYSVLLNGNGCSKVAGHQVQILFARNTPFYMVQFEGVSNA